MSVDGIETLVLSIALDDIQNILGYKFNNVNLLLEAITHKQF
jgi:hypothetical protein